MNSSHSELLNQLDHWVRNGQLEEARSAMTEQVLSHIPRPHRLAFAKLCRRIGLISHGLRILHSVIHREKQLDEPASSEELCEYAVLLSRNGSVAEALQMLNSLPTGQNPEVHLFRGFCHISSWNYEEAIPELTNYIRLEQDPYRLLIAGVNMSASLLAVRDLAKAEDYLMECETQARQQNSKRLLGNILELRAQHLILSGKHQNAKIILDQAEDIFRPSQSYDQLLTMKWRALLAARDRQSSEPLLRFRQEALKRQHWESVREADFFALQIQFEQDRFDHLLIGTPWRNYRKRIQDELQHLPSEAYTIGHPFGLVFDLETGKSNEHSLLAPGKKIHQVLSALLADLYVPCNVGSLFARLYPNEHFNIYSSPLRVHQQLKRARHWLRQNKIPARVQQNQGHYHLNFVGTFGIRIPRDRSQPNVEEIHLRGLESSLAGEFFTVEEACQRLSISRSAFHRLARKGLADGRLIRRGEGRATRYFLKAG